MADLTLSRPQAGQHIVLESVPDSRLVLQFPTDQATMERAGDNLVFSFEDGSKIELANFYTQYSQDTIPDFEVDGTLVAGADFFNAFGPDLMPAAGPGSGVAARSSRYSDLSDSDLLDGINHLNELDWGMNLGVRTTEDVDALGVLSPDGGPANKVPTVMDQYGNVIEDDPEHQMADGSALTGSVAGDGMHSFVWSPGNNAQHGEFTQNPDGSYSYRLDNDDPAVQALGPGQTTQEVFEFTYIDQDGDAATGRVIITIHGVNDSVKITQAMDTDLSVKESGVIPGDSLEYTPGHVSDGGLPDNSFTVTDKDAGDVQYVNIAVSERTDDSGDWQLTELQGVTDPDTGVITVVTEEGVFTLTPSVSLDAYGSSTTTYTYSYDLYDDKMDSLNQGEHRDYQFSITVSDSASSVNQVVNVHIEGTNDKPELTLKASDSVSVDEFGNASLTVNEATEGGGRFGVPAPDADGQSLNADGQTDIVNHTIEVSYTDDDGKTQTVKLGLDPATGNVVNKGIVHTEYGDLTINSDGTYSFKPSDILGKDEHQDLKFDVTITDRHGAPDRNSITITVEGTNDAPVISGGEGKFSLVESGLSPDAGANSHNPVNGGTPHAESSFTVKDADAHDTQTLTLLIKDADGNYQTISASELDIDPDTGVMTYHTDYGDLIITPQNVGSVTFDSDDNPVFTPADPADGITYNYEYQLDNDAANPLTANDKPSFDFEIRVTDSDGESQSQGVLVEIQGTNDIPLMGWSSVDVKEEGVRDGGNEATKENTADNGYIYDTQHRLSATGQIPTFQYKDENGNLVKLPDYDPDKGSDLTFKVEGLRDGDRSWDFGNKVFDFTVTRADGTKESLEVQILNPDDFGKVDGNGHQIIVTNYGTLDLNTKTGEYTFTLDAPEGTDKSILDLIAKNVNELAQGDKLNLGFQATVTDNGDPPLTGTHGIGVIINGTNDQPDLRLADTTNLDHTIGNDFSVDEGLNTGEKGNTIIGGGKVTLGTAVATDDDKYNTTLTFGLGTGHQEVDTGAVPGGANFATNADGSVSIKGTYGTLTIDSKGNFSYEVDNTNGSAADKLGTHWDAVKGEWVPDTGHDDFTIYVKDEHGAWNAQPITVTVNGVNDPPRLVAGDQVSVPEQGVKDGGNEWNNASAQSTSGHLEVLDDDAPKDQQLEFSIAGTCEKGGGKVNDSGASGNDVNGYHPYTVPEGTLYNNDKGDFYFALNNASDAVNGLHAGEDHPLYFAITVKDAQGAELETWLTVNIKGTNDRPTVEAMQTTSGYDTVDANHDKLPDHIADGTVLDANGKVVTVEGVGLKPGAGNLIVKEDTQLNSGARAEGQIKGTDADNDNAKGEGLHYGVAAGDLPEGSTVLKTVTFEGGRELVVKFIDQYGGTFEIDPVTGKYSYIIDNANAKVQGLDEGETLQVKVPVTVMDKHGATNPDSGEVTVTIIGSYDAPEFTAQGWHGTAVEDGVMRDPNNQFDGNYTVNKQDAHGSISATDRDSGDSDSLIFRLDEANVQTDANGVQSVDGEYGTFTFNPETQHWDYTIDPNKAQSLHQDQKVEEHFKITVKDPGGHETSQNVTITVTGTNDKPVLDNVKTVTLQNGKGIDAAAHSTDAIKEDTGGKTEVTGSLAAHDEDVYYNDSGVEQQQELRFSLEETDADGKETGRLSQVLEGNYGRLELQENGEYKYILDPVKAQSLSEGEKVDEVFNVRVTDDLGAHSSSHIVITVTGTNDSFVLSGNAATVAEDVVAGPDATVPSVTGSLHVADVDAKDETSFGTDLKFGDTPGHESQQPGYEGWYEVQGEHGTLLFNPATGEYEYKLTDNATDDIQNLGVGNSLSEHFTVSVTSGPETRTEPITITIKGTNDAPVITGGHAADTPEQELAVNKETGALIVEINERDATAKGSLDATDVDVSKDAQGNEVVEQDHLTFGFLVMVDADGTITPVQVDADGNYSIDGVELTADQAAKVEMLQSIRGEHGTLTINADGSYTYHLDVMDHAVRDMNDNDSLTEHFTVAVKDPQGALDSKPLDVVINGQTNQGGDGSPEPKVDMTDGNLSVKEAPDGDTAQPGTPGTTDSGFISADGKPDGTGAIFSIRQEDADGNVSYVQSVVDQYGTLTVDPYTGEYTYTLHEGTAAVDALAEGASAPGYPRHFTIDAVYGEGWPNDSVTVTVSVTGTNDTPEVDSQVTEIRDDGSISVGSEFHGTITATDVDADNGAGSADHDVNHLTFSAGTYTGKYGTLTLGADGKYTYSLSDEGLAALKALGEGGVLSDEQFDVTVTDAQGATAQGTITIPLHGRNDAPEVAKDGVHLKVWEDGGAEMTDSGSSTAHDPDGDSLTYAGGKNVLQGTYGTLIISKDADGKVTYTYKLDNNSEAVQSLGRNDRPTDTFTVEVSDGKETVKETVTVTVNGANDAPELTVESGLGVFETGEGKTSAEGHYTLYDADKSDTHTFTLLDKEGHALHRVEGNTFETQYGTVTINSDGTYTYTVDADKAAHLGEGQTAKDSFVVQVSDGLDTAESPVDVMITGTNNTPTLELKDLSVTEYGGKDDVLSYSGQIGSDVDDGDKLTYSLVTESGGTTLTLDGLYGTLTIDPVTGEYTYTPNMDAINKLGLGEGQHPSDLGLAEEKFTVQVRDNSGAKNDTFSDDLHITITGTNDAPTIGTTTGGANGSLAFHDADVSDTHTLYVVVGGESYEVVNDSVTITGKGTFTFTDTSTEAQKANGDHNWTYTFKANEATQAGMKEGDHEDLNFKLEVKDNHGVSSGESGDLKVTIDGTNKAPQIGKAALVLGLTDLVPDADFSISSDDANANPADNSLPLYDAPVAGQDHGDSLTYTFDQMGENGDVQGTYGTLHFDADTGQYQYHLHTSAGDLVKLAAAHANGDELKESFDYTVSDHINDSVLGHVDVNLATPSPGAGGSLGDENAHDAQVVFGGAGAESLHGGAGDDILSGGAGDDILFGGDGNDYLFGGAGDDYLDGGTGQNHLYGGAGNDILVYNGESGSIYDGGDGMDVLLVAGNENMNSLFQGGGLDHVTGVEVIISGQDVSDLTNMNALVEKGITLGDNTVDLGEGWAKANDAPDGYHAYTNGDLTVTVGSGVDVHVDTMQEQTDNVVHQMQVENS